MFDRDAFHCDAFFGTLSVTCVSEICVELWKKISLLTLLQKRSKSWWSWSQFALLGLGTKDGPLERSDLYI